MTKTMIMIITFDYAEIGRIENGGEEGRRRRDECISKISIILIFFNTK
jgi:hypothetical protein